MAGVFFIVMFISTLTVNVLSLTAQPRWRELGCRRWPSSGRGRGCRQWGTRSRSRPLPWCKSWGHPHSFYLYGTYIIYPLHQGTRSVCEATFWGQF